MTACQTSGRGDRYDGRDGRGVTRVGGHGRESARTAVWSRGTAECPGPAGSVWCRSSWVSSWASPLVAEVWQIPAVEEILVMNVTLNYLRKLNIYSTSTCRI